MLVSKGCSAGGFKSGGRAGPEGCGRGLEGGEVGVGDLSALWDGIDVGWRSGRGCLATCGWLGCDGGAAGGSGFFGVG